MTELIERHDAGRRSSLYQNRPVDAVLSGMVTWPEVERRRGPRRVEDRSGVDRRVRPHVAVDRPSQVRAPRQPDRHVRGYRQAALCIDVLAAVIGASSAYLLRFGVHESSQDAVYLWGTLALPVLWVAAISMSRAYESRFLGSSAEEYRRVANAAFGLIATIAVVAYALKTDVARGYVVAALPLSGVVSLGGRYFARRSLRKRRAAGRNLQEVVVVGHEWAVLDLVAELRRSPDAGLRVIGACLPGGIGSRRMELADIPVVGDLKNVAATVLETNADVLAVTTCVEFGGAELREVCWALENTQVDVLVAPALIEVAGPRLHIRPVSKLPLLHVEKPEFSGMRRVVKGLFDRTAAAAALIGLSPVFVAAAFAVRLTSHGPVFFRQTRIGVRGEPFTMYKFRSMHVDAEDRLDELNALNDRSDGLLFKIRDDPRVTRVGRWLRRYSIDELPQLINVLKGDMSLVGPRPPLPREVEQYGDDVRRRLLVRPGVTGLWQVSGRSNLTWEESVRLDLRYVENWSLMYDFEILWKTAYAVFRGAGAY